MTRILDKFFKVIVDLLLGIVIAVAFFAVYSYIYMNILGYNYVNVFGYTFFEVASGSMEDYINVYDVVIVKINDDYKVGDVITYCSDGDFITHRVVYKSGNKVITKGDANNANDSAILNKNVVGRVVKILPEAGIWRRVLTSSKVIVSILITLFLFSFTFSYNKYKRKKLNLESDDDVLYSVRDKDIPFSNKKE